MRKISLRNRILLPVLLLITVTIAVVGLLVYIKTKSTLVDNLRAQMEYIAESNLSDIATWINDRKANVMEWSSMRVFALATQDSFTGMAARKTAGQELEKILSKNEILEIVNVVGTNGAVVISSDTNAIGNVNVSDRSYFREALNGKIVVSDFVRSKKSDQWVFTIAAPVQENQVTVGVFFVVVSAEMFMKKFVDPIKILQTGYVYVYNKSGLIIAHPNRSAVMKLDISKEAWGTEMLQRKKGYIDYVLDNVYRLGAYATTSDLGWGLSVCVPMAELLNPVKKIGWLILVIGVISLALASLVVTMILKSVVDPINRLSNALAENASHVGESASHVSASSQSLAQGASEQAASLEETSASLEEMGGITRNNAGNSQKAKELANLAKNAAISGTEDMKLMSEAMSAIKNSSDGIAKIIKTIDEIAFQTNILALNAAVEAARAGEAGMGFAVVADEVRNLAQRSAQAAKETAEKIEDAIQKSQNGVQISDKVAKSLDEITSKAREVDQLVAEIATASNEQSQGIQQISTAMTQMDKVTQSNAANAEESASASSELHSQAEQLSQIAQEMMEVVNGEGSSCVSLPNSVPAVKSDLPEISKRDRTTSKSDLLPQSKSNGNGFAKGF